jgi:5'(3')-deoxyribonucleotidase
MASILVDMDSSINEFDKAFFKYIECKGFGFDHACYNDWDVAKFITGTESYEHSRSVFQMALDDFQFWENIQPMKYASQVLRYYSFYHDITIATVPWKKSDQYRGVKIEWMRKHFPFIHEEQICFSNGNKWDLEGDVIIDDKPDILEKCYGKKITIKPIQPYNRHIKSDFEFTSWKEIPAILDKCEHLLLTRQEA